MPVGISVVIHTYNEEKNIVECIQSARLLTDSIILIDMESTDNTVEIAKKENVQVYSFPHSNYVEPAREFGVSKAQKKWVFLLDADERITKDLAKEIKELTSQHTHYKIPRKEFFNRKIWLKHGGWWPNYQTRLFIKNSLDKWPAQIHSTPVFKGSTGFLKNALLHYSKNDYSEVVKKTVIFEDIESDLLLAAGRPVSTLTFFRKFLGELYRRLIKYRGFLDGPVGIIESIYQAYSKTITYLFLYEKKNRRSL
mgnify:CR=1 FL=1